MRSGQLSAAGKLRKSGRESTASGEGTFIHFSALPHIYQTHISEADTYYTEQEKIVLSRIHRGPPMEKTHSSPLQLQNLKAP
jgi:hypothetical protein